MRKRIFVCIHAVLYIDFISALILRRLTFADIDFHGFCGFWTDPQNLPFSSTCEINPHNFFLGLILTRFQPYSERISNIG